MNTLLSLKLFVSNFIYAYMFPALYGGILSAKKGNGSDESSTETASDVVSAVDYESAKTGITNAIGTVSNFLTTLAVPIATCALIVCGIMYMVSSKKGMDAVTDRLKYVVIGVLVVYGASILAGFLAGIVS